MVKSIFASPTRGGQSHFAEAKSGQTPDAPRRHSVAVMEILSAAFRARQLTLSAVTVFTTLFGILVGRKGYIRITLPCHDLLVQLGNKRHAPTTTRARRQALANQARSRWPVSLDEIDDFTLRNVKTKANGVVVLHHREIILHRKTTRHVRNTLLTTGGAGYAGMDREERHRGTKGKSPTPAISQI